MRRDVFQAIADPTRREIIGLLAQQRMKVNSIAERFSISRPAISQQVKILEECGMVVIYQEGRERYCEIQAAPLAEVSSWLEQYRMLWQDRHDALQGVLNSLMAKQATETKASAGKRSKQTAEPTASAGKRTKQTAVPKASVSKRTKQTAEPKASAGKRTKNIKNK